MLKQIAPDKWRHFIAGIVMGCAVQAFTWWLLPKQLGFATLLSITTVLAISYGFELFSKITGKGRYDFIDAVASAIGGVIGIGSIFLFVFFI